MDPVVAGESARFLSAFTAIGLTPDSSTSWFLPRRVGTHRAMEVTLLNRVLSAREALDWGLVNAVHPDDEVVAVGLALAARLAGGPRAAYGGTRRLVRDATNGGLREHLDAEAASIVREASSADVAALVRGLQPGG